VIALTMGLLGVVSMLLILLWLLTRKSRDAQRVKRLTAENDMLWAIVHQVHMLAGGYSGTSPEADTILDAVREGLTRSPDNETVRKHLTDGH
jgi:hypothetical protein